MLRGQVGRYLGYIADEMNLGLHELGPLAQQSGCRVKINSTCTVFAGAELRERLSLGQKREDILAGLHRAIILRAMSLLARSGGVAEEFTFTGGVARNPAAVGALRELIQETTARIEHLGDSIHRRARRPVYYGARKKQAWLAQVRYRRALIAAGMTSARAVRCSGTYQEHAPSRVLGLRIDIRRATCAR
jgi:hypothetical protein